MGEDTDRIGISLSLRIGGTEHFRTAHGAQTTTRRIATNDGMGDLGMLSEPHHPPQRLTQQPTGTLTLKN
eukprot:scaffold73398_cov52-Attheya_sp.AAC.1